MKSKTLIPVLRVASIASLGALVALWTIRAAEGPSPALEPLLFSVSPASEAAGGIVGGRITLDLKGHRKDFPEWGLKLIQNDDGMVCVIEVVPYFPAARQRIRIGDVLVSVNGEPVKGKGIEHISSMMVPRMTPEGGRGGNVLLGFSRQGRTFLSSLPRGIQTTFARPPAR